ncbi:exported hypothetical protein [Rubrivivax sp. A210]|nr:hypothetical protein [Rubrivivax sp. A210]CAD5373442.1 exported hypothetical protein [Rubrivivax sp. A210]
MTLTSRTLALALAAALTLAMLGSVDHLAQVEQVSAPMAQASAPRA